MAYHQLLFAPIPMEVNLSPRYPTPNPSLGEGLRRRSGGFSWLIWGFTFFCLSCIIKNRTNRTLRNTKAFFVTLIVTDR